MQYLKGKTKQKLKKFQNIVAIFKINPIVFSFFCFYMFALKTLFTYASNPWWLPMKGQKALGTILVNSSANSNLNPRNLSENLNGSL